jgi:N-glycosylase/DNA lyase
MDYKREQTPEAINSVAQRVSIPADEAYREIARVIDMGLSNLSPQVQKAWRPVSRLAEVPALEDVILYPIETLSYYANDLTTDNMPYEPKCEMNKDNTAEEEGE